MRDNLLVVERQVVLFEQVRDQFRRSQVLAGIIPAVAGRIHPGMFDADRMLVVPVVAGVIGNVLLVYNLVDSPITVDNIVDTGDVFDILENAERFLGRALDIVNNNLVDGKVSRSLSALEITGSLLRRLVTIESLGWNNAIDGLGIIDALILCATRRHHSDALDSRSSAGV